MFIGRDRELQALNRLYEQKCFQMVVMYGRRRVGKTSLIREFSNDKPAVFYTATNDESIVCLKDFTRCLKEFMTDDAALQGMESFSDWNAAFDYVTRIAQKRQLILIIDEFPYLAKTYPAIMSVLQKYIDQSWKDTRLYMILSGSSVSFMVDEVLAHESPLYGRRTAQIKLQKMDYEDSLEFFPDWTKTDALYAYSACDGVPQYLSAFARWGNFREAVENEYLKSEGSLFEEPEFLLREELRETSMYNSIIEAISNGANKSNEIASRVGKTPNAVANYLNVLISLEIINKRSPLEDASPKKVIYEVCDNMFRFWYRFVSRSRTLIAMGMPGEAYDKHIEPYMTEYFGHIFEDVCLQYILRSTSEKKKFDVYDSYGKWWGNNPGKKCQEEIDLVAVNDSDILVGECKWTGEKAGYAVFNKLAERGGLVQKNRRIHYVIFSREGFERKLKTAKEPELTLVEMKDLFSDHSVV